MSGVGRPAGQKDKAPRKSRGVADRARALDRARTTRSATSTRYAARPGRGPRGAAWNRDGGDQEAEAASHDAGAADGPEQRADPEREDAEDAFIDDDDDNELDLQAAAGDRAAGSTEPPAAAAA